MTKKIKIKDLEDDPNLPRPKEEQSSRVISLSDVDNLLEDEIVKEPQAKNQPIPKTTIPKANPESQEKPKPEVDKLVYFKRNFFISYISKCLSVFFVLLTLDLVSHFMKYFDGVNVKDFSTFNSIFFNGDQNWNVIKVVGFLIAVYFVSNKDEVIVNKKGLYCINPEITDTIFFISKEVFVSWNEISSVKLKTRLFESYLFFYDKNGKKLGHMEFSLDSKDKFFYYIESNAGKDHPLTFFKKRSSLL